MTKQKRFLCLHLVTSEAKLLISLKGKVQIGLVAEAGVQIVGHGGQIGGLAEQPRVRPVRSRCYKTFFFIADNEAK